MDFPYTIKGESIIKSIVSIDKDRFLATASLASLGKYIPNIDTAKNVDLLLVCFNVFVANRFNRNDDVSDSETSIAIAKSFINKPINIEHKRDKIIGSILNYSFTKFGTNETISEEDALKTKDPFNVTLGGIVWRTVHPALAKLIEECSDPTSESYEKVSASWEVGFVDFAVATVKGDSRNLIDATILTDSDNIKSVKDYMKVFGGKGSKDDLKLYRLIKGEVLALGAALTSAPAADVSGVATEITVEKQKQIDTKEEIKASKNIENISQTEKNIVIQEKDVSVMVKINKIEDITDDLLKQAKASEITEWVKSQFKEADETYQAEKNKLDTQIKASKEASEKLIADQTKLQSELKQVNETLASLKAKEDARVKQDVFNTRMATLDNEFTLVDAEREIIASDISNLDDTAFASYKKKLDVLLGAKKKSAQKEEKKETVKQEAKEVKECKASENGKKETVETALENGEKTKETLAASATATEPSILDKYSKAFGIDQWVSDIRLTE